MATYQSYHIVTETDPHSGALFARNTYGRECGDRVVFVQINELQRAMTGMYRVHRSQRHTGRPGGYAAQAFVRQDRGRFGSMRSDPDPDRTGSRPGARDRRHLRRGPQHRRSIPFIRRFSGLAGARLALESVWEYWNRTLGVANVDTPDAALNVLAKGWLIYQTLSSRLLGRSGHHQSGGAYGFRDQLQDMMALIQTTPWLAREQLIRCAERQFLQGDARALATSA